MPAPGATGGRDDTTIGSAVRAISVATGVVAWSMDKSAQATIFNDGMMAEVPPDVVGRKLCRQMVAACVGTNLESATNRLLVLTNVPLSAAGIYTFVVTNIFGAATNFNATLTVLRSTLRFNGAPTLSDNGFGRQLDQLSGHGSIITLTSTNLVDWVPVYTNPPLTGSLQFLDSGATNQIRRFYRAVEQ